MFFSGSDSWKSFIYSLTLEMSLFAQVLSPQCLVLILGVELGVLHKLQQLT